MSFRPFQENRFENRFRKNDIRYDAFPSIEPGFPLRVPTRDAGLAEIADRESIMEHLAYAEAVVRFLRRKNCRR